MQQSTGFFGRGADAAGEEGEEGEEGEGSVVTAWSKTADAGASDGMANLGNSCFVNASVQLLRCAAVAWPPGPRSSLFGGKQSARAAARLAQRRAAGRGRVFAVSVGRKRQTVCGAA